MERQSPRNKVLKKIASYVVLSVMMNNQRNGQGEVYRCKSPKNREVVIKIPKQINVLEPQDIFDSFQIQSDSIQTLNLQGHQNIIRLVERGHTNLQFENRQLSQIIYPYLVFQLAQKGDLMNLIQQIRINQQEINNFMPQTQIIHIALQLLDGLEYMHLNQFLHLDIKPQNILVFKNNKVKLTDFGHSMSFTNFTNIRNRLIGRFGTPNYWPPQIMNRNQQNPLDGKKIDIFNLGIVILMLYTPWLRRRQDFPNNYYSLYRLQQIISTQISLDVFWRKLLKKRRQFTKRISQSFKRALIGMIHPNPQQRLQIQQIRYQLKQALQQEAKEDKKNKEDKEDKEDEQDEQDKQYKDKNIAHQLQKRMKLNQTVFKGIQDQILNIQEGTGSVSETRGSSGETLLNLYNSFKFHLQKLDISPSNKIDRTQYFGFHPATILAVLSYGLLNEKSSEQQIKKTYEVKVENKIEGTFKVTCIYEDEEQEKYEENIYGEFVRYDDQNKKDEKGEKVNQKYGISWVQKQEELDQDKLNYIKHFEDVLYFISDK